MRNCEEPLCEDYNLLVIKQPRASASASRGNKKIQQVNWNLVGRAGRNAVEGPSVQENIESSRGGREGVGGTGGGGGEGAVPVAGPGNGLVALLPHLGARPTQDSGE